MDPNPDGYVPRLGGPARRAARAGRARTCGTRTWPCAASSRGRCVDEQLEPALALQPDLASVLSGLNDMLRRDCSVPTVIGAAGHDDRLAARGRARTCSRSRCPTRCRSTRSPRAPRRGCATSTSPSATSPPSTARTSSTSRRTPVASDRRLWHLDRLHANPEGHRRIALAAAEALGLEGADATLDDARYDDPLAPRSPRLARGVGRASTSRPGSSGGCAASRPATASPPSARRSSPCELKGAWHL